MGNLRQVGVKCLFESLMLTSDRARIKTLSCGFTVFLSLRVPNPQTLNLQLFVNELPIEENEENEEDRREVERMLKKVDEER